MAEKPEEPSDGMTQPSREKPPWVRPLLPDEIVEMVISGITAFGYALLLLFGASGFVVLSYVCSYKGVSMVWNDIKTHVGVPADDILPLEVFGVGAVSGICCFVVCGRRFARLIQSPLERLFVSSTWFWVLLVLCGTSVLASSLAISLCSVGWRPQWSWSWIWRVLLLGLCVFVFSVVLRLLWRPAKEWMGKLPLFVAIAIWVVLAAALLAVLVKWWGGWPTTSPASGAGVGGATKAGAGTNQNNGAFEAVKSALTAVAGIGGVAYLVIKYRTEQRETTGIADKKISAAVDQLGSDKASTRIAGVYALTDIADTYRGGYRQRVVDILCGYLRSDREAYPLGADGKPATGLPRSGDADKAVESTILSMFVAHLKKRSRDENDVMVRQQGRSDQLWGDCDFDLHGAEFHEMTDFADCVFEGKTDFRLAKFTNISSFSGVKFTDAADFRGAEFKVGVYFICTKFACDAWFSGAELTKADFTGAEFEGEANFDRLEDTAITAVSTKFLGDAIFHDAEFEGKADFTGVEFEGEADFTGVEFEGEAIFNQDDVELNQDDVDATETTAVSTKFLGDAIFHDAEFTGKADFTGVEFERMADFTVAEFKGEAGFNETIFRDGAYFGLTEFRSSADFSEIQGQLSSNFEKCKFNKIYRDTYKWGPIPIPKDNDGLPAGAVWADFPEEDDKDGGTTSR